MKPTKKMLACKNGADDMLNTIKNYTDNVIIAGGFARDWILKTKYNIDTTIADVDVYVKSNSSLKRWLDDLSSKGVVEELTNQYEGLNNLDKVYRSLISCSVDKKGLLLSENYMVEFQIILINTDLNIEDYVHKHFDLSICMATYDGVDFKELPDFTKTMETKIVTFNDDLGYKETEYGFRKHVAKITCRFARFGFKYEGYNYKFTGNKHRCKLINRNRLSDKMMEDHKYLYKTTKYYYYDETAERL